MYYVTMTDKFLSGWGMADGLINKKKYYLTSYHNKTDYGTWYGNNSPFK